ncbi:MAG: ABC transporter permease [Nitrospinae bacterium]|nr:ABC transporter permease [Nitrospinota bacterium]
MQNIIAIFKREFKGYFNSTIAYIFITVFLVLTGWLFFRTFFIINEAEMRGFFGILPWIFLFFVPAITMRLWAEEKKLGTIEILMTLPVKDHEVIFGKFLASYAFLAVTILLSFPLAITVFYLGNPDKGPIIGGYIGALLMGGAFLSIGLFVSSLTENQIIAFIIAVIISFGLLIIGEQFVLFSLPNWLVPLFSYLGLGSHFSSIGRGVVDSRDIIYYLSVILFSIFLNIRTLEGRRW